MANPVFHTNRRLNTFIRRLGDKQGFGMSPATINMLDALIRKGTARMQVQQVLEREEKLRLAEDNLRRLLRSMATFSTDNGKFPIIDDECFNFAIKTVSPIWPFN